MKDTRNEILLSLEGLNSEQMNKVLSFIRNFRPSRSKESNHEDFKSRALREIQIALKNKVFSV